jgi:F0F1-type ATP synthase membrane subunit b/b'
VRLEKPGENGKEPMIEDRVERPAFDVIRGYDRTQVDDYLAETASRESEARGRIEELEATVSAFEDLAETSQRDRERAHDLLRHAQSDRDAAQRKAAEVVEAAHVRAAELDEASRADRREADELLQHAEADRSEAKRRAAELDEASRADRREADELLKQAERDRSEAERRSAEILEVARAEAALLSEESRRDREYASGQVEEAHHKIELLVEEARQQFEWFVEEVEAAAAEGEAVALNGTRPHLDEIRRGLVDLEDQRESVLGDLSRLRESLDGLASGRLGVA